MALHAITERAWVADYLDARLHHGFDLLDVDGLSPGLDGIWCPGHFASLHSMAGVDWAFADAHWWTLPDALVGRRVVMGSAEVIASELEAGERFVKLSRHKYEYFPAQMRTREQFLDDIQDRPWAHLHEFLVSETLDITAEYRVFCSQGRDPVGRTYRSGDWFWGDGEPDDPRAAPAPDRALDLALSADAYIPGSTSVDIAELRDGSLVVLEANPPWCSGFYDLPVDDLTAAIIGSQGRPSDVEVPYVPDPGVREMLKNHRLIMRR